MILVVDNRDSFTWNLVQALREAGVQVRVERSTELDAAKVRALEPSQILIGPGPGGPRGAGASLELVRELSGELPILGVCLGLQVIAVAFGGEIRPALQPVHGHPCEVRHDGRGVFRGLPNPLTVGRYHSLAVDEAQLPDCLEVSARSPEGEIMGLRHRELSVEGVQFHPESVLSVASADFFANYARSPR